MSKSKKSKLDQFAAQLLDMDDEKKTIADIQTWLKEEGCVVSTGTISNFLAGLRQSRLQSQLLSQIASGAQQCAAVEKSFGKNPAPELETLIKLQRVILLNLSTQANAHPQMLDLIGNSFKAVLTAEKLKIQRDALSLDREKFEVEFSEIILTKAVREAAERIAGSSLSQADKIAAMRKVAFKSVEDLRASGKLKIPKA